MEPYLCFIDSRPVCMIYTLYRKAHNGWVVGYPRGVRFTNKPKDYQQDFKEKQFCIETKAAEFITHCAHKVKVEEF